MWLLSQYASAVGNDQAAARWLDLASSTVDATRLRRVDTVVARDMIPDLVISGKHAEAIDAALRSCHAQHVLTPSQGRDQFETSINVAASWNRLDTTDRQKIERFAAHFAVLPSMCWVGMQMLADDEQGIAQGRALASVCRQVAITAADPDLWTAIADTLERIFQTDASVRELIALGNSNTADSRRVVAILAYLGASLHGTPDDAFNLQLAVMEVLFGWFPPTSPTHRRLLLPFIERLWGTRLAQRRFTFRNPSTVEGKLNQARQESPEHRLKAILRAVTLGVVCRADTPTMNWLNTHE